MITIGIGIIAFVLIQVRRIISFTSKDENKIHLEQPTSFTWRAEKYMKKSDYNFFTAVFVYAFILISGLLSSIGILTAIIRYLP